MTNDELADDVDAALRSVASHWDETTPPPPPFPAGASEDQDAHPIAAVTPISGRRSSPRGRQAIAAAAAVAIVVAGVTWASLAGDSTTSPITTDNGTGPAATITSATSTPGTTPASTATTVAAEPAPTESDPADVGPSQSPESAARDGVIPLLAELPLNERSRFVGAVNVQGQQWVATQFPLNLRSQLNGERRPDGSFFDPSSSELLRIEDGKVLEAIQVPSMPLTRVLADEDHVMTYRLGDGGYPDSGFLRLTVATGEIEQWVLPAPDAGTDFTDWDRATEFWTEWQVPDEDSFQRFRVALNIIDPEAQTTALAEAFDQAAAR